MSYFQIKKIIFFIEIMLISFSYTNSSNKTSNFSFLSENIFSYLNIQNNYQSLPSLNVQEYYKGNYVDLILKMFFRLMIHSNYTIFSKHIFIDEDCYDSIQPILSKTEEGKNKLDYMISNSGKSISDIGLEDDCISSFNLTYVFFTYTLNYSILYLDQAFQNLYNFVEQEEFFIGLCLARECNGFYQSFLNPIENKEFYDYLKNTYGVLNLTLYRLNYNKDKEREDRIWNNPNMKFVIIIVWVFSVYVSLRILITIVGYFIYEIKSKKEEILDSIASIDFWGSNDQALIDNQNVNFLRKTKEKEYRKRDGVFYRIYEIFSIRESINILFLKRTKYYNESNLEICGGLRSLIFFFLVYLQTFRGITRLPHRDSTGFSYYSSFWFFVVKFSSNISLCYAALNGFLLGFKIMNFIKKNNNQLSFKNLLIFYFKGTIPPFILCLISFYFFHLNVKELGYLIKDLTSFQYYVDTYINSRSCIIKPEIIFFPFYLQYFKSGPDNDYEECFKWIYFVSSEFYCFTAFLILLYILLKIKSKRLDFSIYILNFFNFILSYFSYNHDLINDNYTLNNVYGEVNTIKYPHLFFFPYFLGINIGIMWFYFKDTTSNNPVTTKDTYHPFFYNFHFMKLFDKLNDKNKFYILITTIILKLILCLNFYLFIQVYSSKETEFLLVKGNFIIDLVFIYEGKIFTMLFLLLLTCILFYSEDSYLKKILSSKLLIPMNRISFSFFISYDFIISIFYAFYHIQIYLNFQNAFFMTLSLLVIIIIFSIIYVLIAELPTKIIQILIIECIVGRKRKLCLKKLTKSLNN